MFQLASILGQCWLCDQPGKLTCGCCDTCFADLPRVAPINLRPKDQDDFCHTWLAACTYEKPLQAWLQAFKFNAQPALTKSFATLIAAQAVIFHKQQQAKLPRLICSVPMSWQRWRKRGYNQAELLAKGVAKILGIPYQPLLIRRAGEHSQHSLGKTQRFANMKNAFESKVELEGGHIVVVDDIITTGATLNSAALALLEAGADQVSGWAVAYTPADSDIKTD